MCYPTSLDSWDLCTSDGYVHLIYVQRAFWAQLVETAGDSFNFNHNPLPWCGDILQEILMLWRWIFGSVRGSHTQDHHDRFARFARSRFLEKVDAVIRDHIGEIVLFIDVTMALRRFIYVQGVVVESTVFDQSWPVVPAARNPWTVVAI